VADSSHALAQGQATLGGERSEDMAKSDRMGLEEPVIALTIKAFSSDLD